MSMMFDTSYVSSIFAREVVDIPVIVQSHERIYTQVIWLDLPESEISWVPASALGSHLIFRSLKRVLELI